MFILRLHDENEYFVLSSDSTAFQLSNQNYEYVTFQKYVLMLYTHAYRHTYIIVIMSRCSQEVPVV